MKRMQESRMVPPILIGRWTPRVLFSLKERPYRHGQLRRPIGSVSQRMLTRTLRNLESTEVCAAGRGDTAGASLPRYAFQKPTRRDERT